jgi:hypothetical protein
MPTEANAWFPFVTWASEPEVYAADSGLVKMQALRTAIAAGNSNGILWVHAFDVTYRIEVLVHGNQRVKLIGFHDRNVKSIPGRDLWMFFEDLAGGKNVIACNRQDFRDHRGCRSGCSLHFVSRG